MAQIIIIGAGLTGISTAYHLEQLGFSDYLLFEKESEPGGLCRSINHDGFIFDYTGHLLHASDSYFYNLISQLVGLDTMNVIDRRSYIYSHGTYTPYPFQINLQGLPAQVIIDCITGYINRPQIDQPQTFREWVQTHFGQGFGAHFFYTYQEKIFAHPIDQITASWTGRFVPKTSLEKILHGCLPNGIKEKVGYNARFLYPKQGGIFSWVKRLAHQLKKPVQTNHCVQQIDLKQKNVTFTNGHTEPYEQLINTMPLDRLLMLIKEPSDSTLSSAHTHLKCSKVVTFNMGIKRPNLSDKHWIYFPEKKYPFYRMGFWHNFSNQMAPPGHSSLYGEFAYMHESADWIQHTLKQSLTISKKLFNITSAEIVTQKVFTIPHAYVTYDHWREQHLPSLFDRLKQYHIDSIGRYGAWKYASMQEAVLDGKAMAKQIIKKEVYEKATSAQLSQFHQPDTGNNP